MTKNAWIQGLILVAAAFAIGIVANGFASLQRKLIVPGWYPNARVVPARAPESVRVAEPPSRRVEPSATTTTAPVVTATTATVAPVPTTTTALAPAPLGDSATRHLGTSAPPPTPEPTFAPHPDKPYVEISGDDVAWLHAKGALFLDARRTSVYEEGHIAGARSFSVWEADVDDKVNKLFDERGDPREQNQPIVIYCSGGACEDSHMLAQKLWGVQFNNVYVYKDGFPDWQKRGGAVRTGAQP